MVTKYGTDINVNNILLQASTEWAEGPAPTQRHEQNFPPRAARSKLIGSVGT